MKRDDKPGQAKSLMLLGALYYETEQLTKAKDYFSRVCIIDPLSVFYYFYSL